VVRVKKHLPDWYTDNGLPPDSVIKPTSNRWTNNDTGLNGWNTSINVLQLVPKGPYRMLVLDEHERHDSAEFQECCKAHNILTVGLPPHLCHFTHTLNVGCFGALKRAYCRQIERFIKAYINHIRKVEFFLAFIAA
jgi:hypothetical protein